MVREIIVMGFQIVLTAICGYLVWLMQQQRTETQQEAETAKINRDANSKGTMLLLRVQMIEYHAKWKKRGFVTRHGLENFNEMYAAYHNLGGNGMVTQMLEEIRDLPIQED